MLTKTSFTGWLGLAPIVVVLAAGCGGSSASQSQARDCATAETCSRIMLCDQIGAGKAYATRESCEVDWRAKWETAWPTTECDGKINSSELEFCLTAIHSTSCNIVDLLLTTGTKCPKATVCSGGSSSPDGG